MQAFILLLPFVVNQEASLADQVYQIITTPYATLADDGEGSPVLTEDGKFAFAGNGDGFVLVGTYQDNIAEFKEMGGTLLRSHQAQMKRLVTGGKAAGVEYKPHGRELAAALAERPNAIQKVAVGWLVNCLLDAGLDVPSDLQALYGGALTTLIQQGPSAIDSVGAFSKKASAKSSSGTEEVPWWNDRAWELIAAKLDKIGVVQAIADESARIFGADREASFQGAVGLPDEVVDLPTFLVYSRTRPGEDDSADPLARKGTHQNNLKGLQFIYKLPVDVPLVGKSKGDEVSLSLGLNNNLYHPSNKSKEDKAAAKAKADAAKAKEKAEAEAKAKAAATAATPAPVE